MVSTQRIRDIFARIVSLFLTRNLATKRLLCRTQNSRVVRPQSPRTSPDAQTVLLERQELLELLVGHTHNGSLTNTLSLMFKRGVTFLKQRLSNNAKR